MKSIENEKEYKDALARAYSLMQLNLVPELKESDELEILSLFIEKYEKEQYPVVKEEVI